MRPLSAKASTSPSTAKLSRNSSSGVDSKGAFAAPFFFLPVLFRAAIASPKTGRTTKVADARPPILSAQAAIVALEKTGPGRHTLATDSLFKGFVHA